MNQHKQHPDGRTQISVYIDVPLGWEKRLDHQPFIQAEIEADRWIWDWSDRGEVLRLKGELAALEAERVAAQAERDAAVAKAKTLADAFDRICRHTSFDETHQLAYTPLNEWLAIDAAIDAARGVK
jgi:hypothetical protein